MSREKERMIFVVLLITIGVFLIHQTYHKQSKASLQSTRAVVKWSQQIDARVSRIEKLAGIVKQQPKPAAKTAPKVVEDTTEGGE